MKPPSTGVIYTLICCTRVKRASRQLCRTFPQASSTSIRPVASDSDCAQLIAERRSFTQIDRQPVLQYVRMYDMYVLLVFIRLNALSI